MRKLTGWLLCFFSKHDYELQPVYPWLPSEIHPEPMHEYCKRCGMPK